jgi:threonylcarbamoyladenosine tRNA methylthiotransferase MtaB
MSVDVHTFGCRLNSYESEIIRRNASGLGDAVVINTCAVTAEAVRQARQTIRKARRDRPDARIVVTGCAAQAAPQDFAGMAEVDHVLGNEEKLSVSAWAGLDAAPRVRVGDIMTVRALAPHPVDALQGHTRGFVQVQTGCDHRCTFCIIPFGRGNSRSLPMADVVAQVRRLADNGYREVVLTGVDITSYGADLHDTPRLGVLVKAVLKAVPDIERLRLSSIDSVEADADLFDALANEPRLMPHLHLSLQAGDDMILKRMKRRHSRADAIKFCNDVRRLRPDVVFGGDIIAGFPTETDVMFARSLDLVDECALTHRHVFPFSPRPGTPAARMPQIAGDIVKERAAQLRAKGSAALARHLESEIGAQRRVLTEAGDIGRTEQFTAVRLNAPVARGLMLDVAITGHDGRQLLAA